VAAAVATTSFFRHLEARGIAVASCEIDSGWDDRGLLLDEERLLLAGMAAVRRREFIAGRAQARALMARSGHAPAAILPGAGRQPIWPEGLVGSITHSRRFCAVAIAPCTNALAIGIDLEPFVPIEAGLHRMICRPDETEALAEGRWPHSLDELVSCIFSAKEAFYKAWYPLAGRFLEYRDVTVSLAPDLSTFTVDAARHCDPTSERLRLSGEMAIDHGHVACSLVWPPDFPAPVPPRPSA
jgi:4'-phosphopantetheinyl transferase EntD